MVKKVDNRKPQEVATAAKEIVEAMVGSYRKVEDNRPLRAKSTLTDYERGFLAGLDASFKVAYEHERAQSTATPIADQIQDLQPE